MDGDWFNVLYDNVNQHPSSDYSGSQQPVTHQTTTGTPSSVSPKAADDKYARYTEIPGHFKHSHDRGKPRSDAELKSIFYFNCEDNTSANIPRVLQLLCAYSIGLQNVREQLVNVYGGSPDPMETDSSTTESSELFDDYASDADYIWCGMVSSEYQERLKIAESARTYPPTYTWIYIYEQFVTECSTKESLLAKRVYELRNNPDGDVQYFCRVNLLRYTRIMIEKWKRLKAVATKLQVEKRTLNRLAYPCKEVYSDTELHFDTDEFLSRVDTTDDIPHKWNNFEDKDSNSLRKTRIEVNCSFQKIHDAIIKVIKEMDAKRTENYVKQLRKFAGLTKIVSKLDHLYRNISHVTQELYTSFTEEEIWYNEFDLSYVEMYCQNADCDETWKAKWDCTTKDERPRLAAKDLEACGTLRQQYGRLVKDLRLMRESHHIGIKTHVSELEARVYQLQSVTKTQVSELEEKNVQLQSQMTKMENDFKTEKERWYAKDLKTQQRSAELTNRLDDANYNIKCVEKQVESRWKQYCTQMYHENQRQMEQQQGKLAEAMNKISELRIEKEKLLTRLSKIAGNKLVQGNPAITDLSDVNRPTKLSERYSELYDNEWTDALEELTDSIVQGGEVVCTKTLLGILIEAFTFCCETEVGYVKTIKDSLTTLPGSGPGRTEHEQKDTTDSITLSEEQGQQLNDLMKTCVPMMTKTVELKFLTQMEKQFDHVIKTAGGSIKHDFQTPLSEHKEQKTLSDPNEPKTTAYTEDQATGQGNTDHGGKDHINTNEDVSTPKSNTNLPHPSGVEQATADTSDIGTTPSKQAPTDRASEKHHRKFEFGPSNVTSNQTNQQNDDTSSESDTTDTTFQIRFSSLAHTYKFAKSCVNLCWLMRIQNPPLHMDTELVEGSDINGEFYKNYTQKGKQVGYLVWPALFLHKDGPLLCKGIVQPSSNRKP